jgi:hypothetical protein
MEKYINQYGINSSYMRDRNPSDLLSPEFMGRAFLAHQIRPWESPTLISAASHEVIKTNILNI